MFVDVQHGSDQSSSVLETGLRPLMCIDGTGICKPMPPVYADAKRVSTVGNAITPSWCLDNTACRAARGQYSLKLHFNRRPSQLSSFSLSNVDEQEEEDGSEEFTKRGAAGSSRRHYKSTVGMISRPGSLLLLSIILITRYLIAVTFYMKPDTPPENC